MAIRKNTFGEFDAYTIENKHGASVRVTDLGAAVLGIIMPDRDGNMADVTLGYDTPGEYLAHDDYFGAFVGRYANRIANAAFNIDGREYRLTANEGANTLHGGVGLSKRRFRVVSAEGERVMMAISDPDGGDGFPGKVDITVTYELNDLNEFSICYTAASDADTHLCLTNHSYFNLRGRGDVLSHELFINADAYLPVDHALIPTGEIRPVSGTAFDFGRRRVIENGCYDHCFILRGAPCAELYDPISGRKMTVTTDMPAVQLYAGGALTARLGRGGAVYGTNSGMCLETQFYPDSPNHPEFPSTLLRPDELYRSKTVYKFSVE